MAEKPADHQTELEGGLKQSEAVQVVVVVEQEGSEQDCLEILAEVEVEAE